MATHHVQIAVRRAARRPRVEASLPLYIGLLAVADGLASAGTVIVAVRLLGLGWLLGAMLGFAAALVTALCGAAAGARISQALGQVAQAAREVALGGSCLRLPAGPGAEIARLSSAISTLSASIAEDRTGTLKPLPAPGETQ
jgi:HAMP domain-containing protein